VNKTIALMTIKQLRHRPARLLVLTGFLGFPLLFDIMNKQMEPYQHPSNGMVIGNTIMLALIVAAGIIGQDISDGILPLIFSRPIKRWHYVLTKWLTVVFIVSALSCVNLFCHLLVCYGFTVDIFRAVGTSDLLQIVLMSAGTTSVMLLLSSLLPGAADLGVILLISAACILLMLMQSSLHVPGMEATANVIFAVLYPSFDPGDIHIHSLHSLLSVEVGRYFAVVLVCLSGSIVLVNQKELSYGSD
jgi:ABC-type transport system involved in multi-copper enzyme maturation permease subunit